MSKQSRIPLPNALAMPLRDALRGLGHSAASPARLAEPLVAALPGPIQSMIERVAQRLPAGPDAGDRAALWRVGALGGLAGDGGQVGDGATAAVFARVACAALSLAAARLKLADVLVSETVAGLCYRAALAELPNDAAPAERAAAIALHLRDGHAVGPAPGTGLGLGRAEDEAVNTAAFALALWLLVDREAPEGDEAEVLTLCVDLAQSLAEERAAAGRDRAALAELLAAYAAVI